MILYDKKITNTHMVDITIESEAWVSGALAAEGLNQRVKKKKRLSVKYGLDVRNTSLP